MPIRIFSWLYCFLIYLNIYIFFKLVLTASPPSLDGESLLKNNRHFVRQFWRQWIMKQEKLFVHILIRCLKERLICCLHDKTYTGPFWAFSFLAFFFFFFFSILFKVIGNPIMILYTKTCLAIGHDFVSEPLHENEVWFDLVMTEICLAIGHDFVSDSLHENEVWFEFVMIEIRNLLAW